MKQLCFLFAVCTVVMVTAPRLKGAQPEPVAPIVVFEPGALVISTAGPGEPVAVLGVNLVRRHGVARNERIKAIVTPDATGVARLQLDAPLSPFSRWAVVGLTTGGVCVVTPPGSPLRGRTETPDEVRPGQAGLVDLLVTTRPNVELLVVSPKQGAWVLSSGDGYVSDADGKPNGQTTIRLDLLAPIDPSFQTLRTVKPGDVVVVIETFSFDYSLQVVNR
ncbi:MAG: hypothetical protein ACSLE8_19720 [Rhodococcus sp. (in: high G+C Gram-positive bacteria)]